MRNGLILLGFGELEAPSLPAVEDYLERIFSANALLRGTPGAQADRRARRLAEARAPALVEDYERIGGSPHDAQLRWQAESLERVLRLRGLDVPVFVGHQFTSPSTGDALRKARQGGIERVIALPTYPIAGPSTTDAALAELSRERERMGWDVEIVPIPVWHRQPAYRSLRTRAIHRTAARAGIALSDPGVQLVFSAHGTPLQYLKQGSLYVAFVKELCAAVADELGIHRYVIGYQNHDSGPGIAWTQPSIGDVIASLDADAVVVDPVSFMHEQSETLAELDLELRAEAEARGISFYRVPIPWNATAFVEMLADLVEAQAAPTVDRAVQA